MKYIWNDIVKPFRVKILRYAKRIIEVHDLNKYLPPPSLRGESAEADNWTVCNQEFVVSEIWLAIKDRIPSSMQNELEYHQGEYSSLTYEYWWNLLSTIEVKEKRKRAAIQIKKIDSAREASLSDSNKSSRIPMKKEARTGILRSNKGPQRKAHKHHVTQSYCMICNKSGMPAQKYTPKNSEKCMGMRTNCTIKDRMGGYGK